jgi:heat shock protein beta
MCNTTEAATTLNDEEIAMILEKGESFEFQAEVSRLMDIIINSLYKSKEIFLRELISNAADALDKIRFLGLKDPDALNSKSELEILIKFDKKEKTFSIRDTGIGMSKKDLVDSLGTVAKSGTANFMEQLAEAKGDVELIGQFGVGFYSVYLVADRVQVTSKKNGDDQYIWTSTAEDTFTVMKDPKGDTLGRGTEIKLFLKDEALNDFTNAKHVRDLIGRYSQFVSFPIKIWEPHMEIVDVEDDDEEDEEEDEDDEEDKEEDAEDGEALEIDDDDTAKQPKTEQRTVWDWELVNNVKPVWTRSKEDITDDEYNKFYKAISNDRDEPAAWTHFKAEGDIDFKALMYIPKKPPMNYYEQYAENNSGLKLYVKKVLLSDEVGVELIPKYLSFLKGIIDSDDLPINVSRETLQESKVTKIIRKKLVRKALELFRKMAEEYDEAIEAEKEGEESDDDNIESDPEWTNKKKYETFWNQFGKSIKMGVLEDSANKEKLLGLLRFRTTVDDEKSSTWQSLDKYVSRMKEGQKEIYYIAGSTMQEMRASPMIEMAIENGLEVLLMDDPLDEWVIKNAIEYDGHKFISVASEKFSAATEDTDEDHIKKVEDAYRHHYGAFSNYLQMIYTKEKVRDIKFSRRLVSSPAILVPDEYSTSANMRRIIRSQAAARAENVPDSFHNDALIMEINPRHPIIEKLAEILNKDSNDPTGVDIAWLLYDQALTVSGFPMTDVEGFAGRVQNVIGHALNIESMELSPEIEPRKEEEVEEVDIEDEVSAEDLPKDNDVELEYNKDAEAETEEEMTDDDASVPDDVENVTVENADKDEL